MTEAPPIPNLCAWIPIPPGVDLDPETILLAMMAELPIETGQVEWKGDEVAFHGWVRGYISPEVSEHTFRLLRRLVERA